MQALNEPGLAELRIPLGVKHIQFGLRRCRLLLVQIGDGPRPDVDEFLDLGQKLALGFQILLLDDNQLAPVYIEKKIAGHIERHGFPGLIVRELTCLQVVLRLPERCYIRKPVEQVDLPRKRSVQVLTRELDIPSRLVLCETGPPRSVGGHRKRGQEIHPPLKHLPRT